MKEWGKDRGVGAEGNCGKEGQNRRESGERNEDLQLERMEKERERRKK